MKKLHFGMPKITLRRFNNFLTAVVLVLGAYIVLLPFVPALDWWFRHEAPVVSSAPHVATPAPSAEAAPKDNTLVIPTLAMKELVHEGTSIHTLRYGVWHLPGTSTPDKGGNMVMAGHRFTYAGAAVFYNLDKVKKGDQISMYWQHKRYDYKVRDVLTVLPTDVAVAAPTKNPMLTIYTCTPLWSTKYRLVIQADLMRTV